MTRRRTAVLISGRGSNMAALLDAARDPSYPAEIVLVLANKAGAAGLARAAAAGVATAVVESRAFKGDRPGFEAAMEAALAQHGVELLALAGFMRVLTEEFVGRWQGRLLNIHPSLLPAFPGLETHERALAGGRAGAAAGWPGRGGRRRAGRRPPGQSLGTALGKPLAPIAAAF
jgi:phosphoribosylglycinamide formyltransferase-1